MGDYGYCDGDDLYLYRESYCDARRLFVVIVRLSLFSQSHASSLSTSILPFDSLPNQVLFFTPVTFLLVFMPLLSPSGPRIVSPFPCVSPSPLSRSPSSPRASTLARHHTAALLPPRTRSGDRYPALLNNGPDLSLENCLLSLQDGE